MTIGDVYGLSGRDPRPLDTHYSLHIADLLYFAYLLDIAVIADQLLICMLLLVICLNFGFV